MNRSRHAAAIRSSAPVIVVRVAGVEVGLAALLAILTGSLLAIALVLGFSYLVVLHLTRWSDAAGIAKVLRAIIR